jgi:hypothetical protein
VLRFVTEIPAPPLQIEAHPFAVVHICPAFVKRKRKGTSV